MGEWSGRMRRAADRVKAELERQRGASVEANPSDIYNFTSDPDPWLRLAHFFSMPEHMFAMPLAANRDMNFIGTSNRRHCLILGPPRCFKSTGVLAPQVLTAPGPVVSTSTKPDMYRATAVARARKGKLWHLALDDAGVLPGCIPLRWSPVTASTDWGRAQAIGHGMAAESEIAAGSTDSNYFRVRSGELISALLHAAALAGQDLGWVMSGISGSSRTLNDAQAILSRSGHHLSLDPLRQLVELDPRSRDSIFSTAQTAFVAYRDPQGYETTQNPNFDPDAFVAGTKFINQGMWSPNAWAHYQAGVDVDWPRGEFDTIYITAPTIKQKRLAPLIMALLGAIREATFRQYARYERGMEDLRPPVFWALDECASIAPLTDLPETGAQGAGQGLLVTVVLQDLAQAEKRWKEDAKSFGSLFGDKVVFPGIENRETLQAFSELLGKERVKRTQIGQHFDPRSKKPSMSYTYLEELLPVLEPADINRGGPQTGNHDPRRVLVSKQGGEWGWCYSLPYFNSPPFAHALISSTEHISKRMSPFDLRARALVPRFDSESTTTRQSLDHAGGPELVEHGLAVMSHAIGPRAELVRCVDELVATAPLLKGWTGDKGVTFRLRGSSVALAICDDVIDVRAAFAGFELEPWDREYFQLDSVPDDLAHWDMADSWFHVATYSTPSSIAKVLDEAAETLHEAGKPPLPTVDARTVVALQTADRVGNHVIRTFVESVNAPLFLPVTWDLEDRRV